MSIKGARKIPKGFGALLSQIANKDASETYDQSVDSLEAISGVLESFVGGIFFDTFGPQHVIVDDSVALGIVLLDSTGGVISTGEITPGTYTVHRIRAGVDTEIVTSTPSSEATGSVYLTYTFPGASWTVGDIFYTMFSGIKVTIGGVTTSYPTLFNFGQVVLVADVEVTVGAIKTQTDKLAGTTPGVGTTTANWFTAESNVVSIGSNDTKYKVHALIISLHNLVGTIITLRMYMQVNGVERKVQELKFDTTIDPLGIWLIEGSLSIHEVLRITLQSNKSSDNGKGVDYDYMLEAM
jgi:hypothetical protein